MAWVVPAGCGMYGLSVLHQCLNLPKGKSLLGHFQAKPMSAQLISHKLHFFFRKSSVEYFLLLLTGIVLIILVA